MIDDSKNIIMFDSSLKDVLTVCFSDSDTQLLFYDVYSQQFVNKENSVDVLIVRTDWLQVIQDSDFFTKRFNKLMEELPELVAQNLRAQRENKAKLQSENINQRNEFLKTCSSLEYLKATLLPHLGSALVAMDNERPNDPVAFLAATLLENEEMINSLMQK